MIEKRTLWAMAVGSGLAVANIYYVQPLLADMGLYFGVPDRRMGLISMLSQVGYATGMLLFLPLGDRLERRSFILAMLGAVTVALLGVAAAPNFSWLAAASLAVGVTSITPQLLVPFAAHLAEPAERGQVVGTVMSGLLIGILAARTVSGLVGNSLGWRAMYGIAAAVMVALAVSLQGLLPRSQPEGSGVSYFGLLRSIGGLLREEPVLRQSCLLGAMSFGAFSAFWTTLAFHLARSPFGYGSGVVGLFGLVGIVGALAAPWVGRFADRRSPRWTIGAGLVCILLSYAVLYELGAMIGGLVVGVILLDLGAQSAHISNQSRIYAIRPEARSRMNTAYMVAYFIGGSLGSYGGAWGWGRAGWSGVCLVGLGMTGAGLLAFIATAGVRLSETPISIGDP
jgi:predicted MFS family arabinose efflux permease